MSSKTTEDFAVTSWTQCPICAEFVPQENSAQHAADHENDGPNVWRCWHPDCRRVFKSKRVLHIHYGKAHRYKFEW